MLYEMILLIISELVFWEYGENVEGLKRFLFQ